MAVELATAYVSIVASARGIRGSIERELDVDGVAKSEGAKAGRGFAQAFDEQSARKLQDTGRKMMLAGGLIAGGLLGAANAAGNLNAAIAANEQVLGDASRTIRSWADDSVEAVGLSERAAIEATTSFGGLGKIIGLAGEPLADFSTGMVEAAADMAAFKDVPVDQALADLQSGFAGSTEVLRKYNIFLDDASLKAAYFRATGEEVSGTLTSQQRIIATHAEIMRQGADMWGQWDRESEEFGAQQSKIKAQFEDMSAQLGQTFLPAATAAAGGMASMFGAIADVDRASGGLIGRLGVASAGLLSFGGGAVWAVGKVGQLRTSIANMGSAAKVATAGIGLAGAALAVYSLNAAHAAREAETFSRVQDTIRNGDTEESLEALAAGFRLAEVTGKDANKVIYDAVAGNAALAEELIAAAESSDSEAAAVIRGSGALDVLHDARNRAIVSAERQAEQQERNSEILGDTAEVTDDAAQATEAMERALRDAASAAGVSSPAMIAMSEAEARVAEKSQEAHDKLRDLIDEVQSGLTSVFDHESAMLSLENAYSDYEVQLWETTAALNSGELSDRDAAAAKNDLRLTEIQLADDAANTALEFARQAGAVDGSTESAKLQRQALERLADQFPELADEIDTHIGKLDAIPGVKETSIRTIIDEAAFDSAEWRLYKLSLPRDTYITPQVAKPGSRFADGSVVTSPTVALFGEAGAEAVLPLTRPGRMADIVNDSRVRPAVLEALGADISGGGGGGRGPLVGTLVVGGASDVPQMRDELARLDFLARYS